MMNPTEERPKEEILESIEVPIEHKKEYILDSFGTVSNNGEPVTAGPRMTDDDEIMNTAEAVEIAIK